VYFKEKRRNEGSTERKNSEDEEERERIHGGKKLRE
jgi:hypothetical protein